LIEHAFKIANERSEDLEYLKSLLFKVAECSYKSPDKNDWPSPKEFIHPEDSYENSSIFVNAYESISTDGRKMHYATVSSTVLV
jgi:hypothetical protein